MTAQIHKKSPQPHKYCKLQIRPIAKFEVQGSFTTCIALYKSFSMQNNTEVLDKGWTVWHGINQNISKFYPYECPVGTGPKNIIQSDRTDKAV